MGKLADEEFTLNLTLLGAGLMAGRPRHARSD